MVSHLKVLFVFSVVDQLAFCRLEFDEFTVRIEHTLKVLRDVTGV